jgi:hypothetical protein
VEATGSYVEATGSYEDRQEGRKTLDGRLSLSAKPLNRRLILAFSAMAAVMVLQDIVGAFPARALTTTPNDT